MNLLDHIKKVYFIGIGGIGMSALARYFLSRGAEVSGYDKTPGMVTESLIREGIPVYYNEDPAHITAGTDLVVYTPAVPASHSERIYAEKAGLKMMKRSEVLGLITSGMFTVAVAGTHGKTSITGMTAHMLKNAGFRISAFIGGISKNFGTNFIFDPDPQIAVVEADEYDRSFLRLEPDIAVITSMDPDHLDIYGTHNEMLKTFGQFVRRIRPGGSLILHDGLEINLPPEIRLLRYGMREDSDFAALNPNAADGRQKFVMKTAQGKTYEIEAGVPGIHNVENALAAACAGSILGVPDEKIAEAIAGYRGIVRRFDVRFESPHMVYIDDYAHHPEELNRLITAVRAIYPGKYITGIFQPHLFTRTRDLAEGFADSLGLLDELWMMEIYPARELPIPGIDSRFLLDKISVGEKCLFTPSQLAEKLEGLREGVLLTAGAGDVDQLVPVIEEIMNKKYLKP